MHNSCCGVRQLVAPVKRLLHARLALRFHCARRRSRTLCAGGGQLSRDAQKNTSAQSPAMKKGNPLAKRNLVKRMALFSMLLFLRLLPLLVLVMNVIQTTAQADRPTKAAVPVSTTDEQVKQAAVEALKGITTRRTEPSLSGEVFQMEKILHALSQESTAEVLHRREKNFFGLRIPVEVAEMEKGKTLYLVVLVRHMSTSAMTRELNPWPLWEMSCAKLFTEKPGQFSLMEIVTPPREQGIEPHSALVKMAADAAVKWLQSETSNDKISLSGILGAEQQGLAIEHISSMDGAKAGQTKWDADVNVEKKIYFLSLLLDADGSGPLLAQPHIFAVSVSKSGGANGGVVVAHYTTEPGNAMVSGQLRLNGFTEKNFYEKTKIQAIRSSIAKVGEAYGVVGPEAVEITSVEGTESPGGIDEATISFVIGVAGSGKALTDQLSMVPGINALLSKAISDAGIKVSMEKTHLESPRCLATSANRPSDASTLTKFRGIVGLASAPSRSSSAGSGGGGASQSGASAGSGQSGFSGVFVFFSMIVTALLTSVLWHYHKAQETAAEYVSMAIQMAQTKASSFGNGNDSSQTPYSQDTSCDTAGNNVLQFKPPAPPSHPPPQFQPSREAAETPGASPVESLLSAVPGVIGHPNHDFDSPHSPLESGI